MNPQNKISKITVNCGEISPDQRQLNIDFRIHFGEKKVKEVEQLWKEYEAEMPHIGFIFQNKCTSEQTAKELANKYKAFIENTDDDFGPFETILTADNYSKIDAKGTTAFAAWAPQNFHVSKEETEMLEEKFKNLLPHYNLFEIEFQGERPIKNLVAAQKAFLLELFEGFKLQITASYYHNLFKELFQILGELKGDEEEEFIGQILNCLKGINLELDLKSTKEIPEFLHPCLTYPLFEDFLPFIALIMKKNDLFEAFKGSTSQGHILFHWGKMIVLELVISIPTFIEALETIDLENFDE